MKNVFIVVKKCPALVVEGANKYNLDLSDNEAVFETETEAQGYIDSRRAAKDPRDKGAWFNIEPWHVGKIGG